MRYEAVGNNLHGALAGEDHREDDFNFFLKRNRVNNLPWSVDDVVFKKVKVALLCCVRNLFSVQNN